MSIQAFKKKGIIRYGNKISGRTPGGIWQMRGPFGSSSTFKNTESAVGAVGFSINGGTRNVGYVGQSMAMSRNGTPYNGQFARGSGGHFGKYLKAEPVFNAARADTQGSQYEYIKPSVLSSKGMLEGKYMWIHNGRYPNYWVQPVYGNDNLSMNASQQVYITKKAATYSTVTDTNKPHVYNNMDCNNSCGKPSARYTFKTLDSQSKYTKTLAQPLSSAQYTLQIQRACANPTGEQKPFPFATRSGSRSGKSSTAPNPIHTEVYFTPPEWYTSIGSKGSCSFSNAVALAVTEPVIL